MSKMARKIPNVLWRWLIALFLVVPLLVVLLYCIKDNEHLLFWRLQLVARYGGSGPKKYATALRETRPGVRLAIADLSVTGGSTKGWSSWIVRTSPLDHFAVEQLEHLLSKKDVDICCRLEAMSIYTQETRSVKYLLEWFGLVQGASVKKIDMQRYFGRYKLANAVGNLTTDEELASLIRTSPPAPVPISLEDFRDRVLGGTAIPGS